MGPIFVSTAKSNDDESLQFSDLERAFTTSKSKESYSCSSQKPELFTPAQTNEIIQNSSETENSGAEHSLTSTNHSAGAVAA